MAHSAEIEAVASRNQSWSVVRGRLSVVVLLVGQCIPSLDKHRGIHEDEGEWLSQARLRITVQRYRDRVCREECTPWIQ